jgi:hypothetical protein
MKRMQRPRLISACLGAAASLLASGCSGASPPAFPTLPELIEALSVTEAEVVGPPTEVYARVARGAMACWFGASGPLKADYVYHAEAQPAAQGGKSEIIIHELDRQSENPRGLKAFRVSIMPKGDTATLTVENLKLAGPQAKSMENDVRRWAAGAIGCSEPGREWAPEGPDPDPATWKSRSKKKNSPT